MDKATISHLWKVMTTETPSWELEESECYSYIQELGSADRLVSLSSIPGKVMKQIIVEIHSGYKDKTVIASMTLAGRYHA